MSAHTQALEAVRAARAERDAARHELYAARLRALALERAAAREARGEGTADPAATAALRALRDEAERATARLSKVEKRIEALQALPGTLAELVGRVDAFDQQSAQLAEQAAALGGAIEQAPRAAREPVMARLRAVQMARAEAEHAAQPLREAVVLLRGEVAMAGAEVQALGAERAKLVERLAAIDHELAAIGRDSAQVQLGEALDAQRATVGEARAAAAERDDAVRQAIMQLWLDQTPETLTAQWNDGLPVLLLPLRLETRWKAGGAAKGPELWVRAYPDDVAVNTHEAVLTEAEVRHGRAYWSALLGARTDEARDLAWRALATRLGANRAAWVAPRTKPLDWDVALAAALASAPDAAPVTLNFPDPPLTKPDGWTEAPHTRVLPDRLVLMAWRGGERVHTQVGAPIDDVVVLGPAPLEDAVVEGAPGEEDPDRAFLDRANDGTLRMGAAWAWVRDFGRAVAAGMGFRVPLTADDVAHGFDQLVVLGLKHSASESDARALVEALVENHRYSREGFSLVAQGTATNNTGGADSGYSRDGAGPAASPPGAAELFTPVDDRAVATDGQRLADWLGIGYAPLLHAPGAALRDHTDAVAMNRALYAGTLGYYLDHALNEVVDDDVLPLLRRHFTTQVTGRGPIAAIRVGSQPYGIIPTSVFGRWQPSRFSRGGKAGATVGGASAAGASTSLGLISIPDPFETALLAVLARFDQAWETLAPGVAQVGAAGEGAARLLEVLGLHPTSAEFYQRVGYSYDSLANLASFTWDDDAVQALWRAALEGQAAFALLRSLGYTAEVDGRARKPVPLLLQLLWRAYHTQLDPRQLIDGRPLSETEGVRPYAPPATQSYLDWLYQHAADAEALEAQSFGTAPRPGYLLYMLLHFSLVMEAGRGIHRWLGERGVRADELVRSRKFLNIGAQATPSHWEVFRAPASSIVQAEPGTPLLQLLHAPQLAGGAGDGVREQREGLNALRAMSTARLERALVEHVDTLSYRLDAWQTSLFSRRLHRQRRMDAPVAERRTGVYLGAYGYLEELRPAPARRAKVRDDTLPEPLREGVENLFHETGSGGFVHAPSLNHATAAALLRNGYLTHATPGQPDALAVNLSSARVRRARYLLDGLRNGQSLETLLGAQFERGLHDWTTRPGAPVLLDQLKPDFRAAFPIRRTRVPQSASGGTAEITEDRSVVNGLDLARATAWPYGIPALEGLDAGQRNAIVAEKTSLENTLDALRDVLTAEAAYQLALGNFDRAAAVVQSTGSATPPPDVEVLRTPRGTGIAFTNRLAVQLDPATAVSPWPGPLTARALAETALNQWVGMLLGDPATVRCVVTASSPPNAPEIPGLPLAGIVSLADLGVQPLDFVFLARGQADETGVAELEARIRYALARAQGVPDAAVVHIAFASAGSDPAARPFAEVLPLADRLRRLLGAARPLNARHFQSASHDAPAPADNPGLIDTAELHARVSAVLAVIAQRFTELQTAADAARVAGAPVATVNVLRAALVDVAATGFGFAVPVSAVGTTQGEVDALVAQADSLLARATAQQAATASQLARAAPAAAGTAEQKASLLSEAARAWLGADFTVLPRFTYFDAAAVGAAHADTGALLAFARTSSPLPVEEWLHGVSCVRPQAHAFEMVRAMAGAALAEELEMAPVQLPWRAGDSWLGAQYPPAMEVVHDTVSVVRHLPQGFPAAAGAQCGLLIDEWTERMPTREEVTGLTFNYNAPNSAPPQALLLAVTPHETGEWAWDDLVETVRDTFRRARARAVEPDAVENLGGIGVLLPAVLAEFSTSRGSVSLDYSWVLEAIRLPALQMMTLAAAPGAGEG